MANNADSHNAGMSKRRLTRFGWISAFVILILVCAAGALTMLKHRNPSLGSLDDDIVTAKSAVAAIELCLLAGQTSVTAPPNQTEMDRCVTSIAKEKKAAIGSPYAWYINSDPLSWAPGRPASTEWLIAVCDPVSGEPYCLVRRDGSTEMTKELSKDDTKRILASFVRLSQ
jgi:hypothetical protein